MSAAGNYVQYGTGNMLNIDVGTIKRKMDSNEYDGDAHFEMQPNCKRTCNPVHGSFESSMEVAMAAAPQTPNHHGSPWAKSNSISPMQQTPYTQQQQQQHQHQQQFYQQHQQHTGVFGGFQTPDSIQQQPSISASPTQSFLPSSGISMMMDTSMEAPTHHPMVTTATPLMPSAMPAAVPASAKQEYVPIHGRSMEIPSYARVPLNEVRKYREQRWSSCIYSADARIGQGMML